MDETEPEIPGFPSWRSADDDDQTQETPAWPEPPSQSRWYEPYEPTQSVPAPPPEAPAEPPPALPTGWERPPAPERADRSGQSIWVVALVAAVVGALVGGGVALAVRPTKTRTVTQTSLAPSRTPTGGSGTPAPPLVTGNQIRDLLDRVEPAVVTISTGNGAGTGMIISSDGEVLTNAHVVEGASTVKVTLFKETGSRSADVVGRGDANNGPDVALVKIRNATNLPTVTLGNSDDIAVGDDVVAIGNALNLAGGPTVTKGIVSAKDRTLADTGTDDTYIQTDAAINPGNSGGPLVRGDGQVIGMNTLVIQQAGPREAAQNLGFAIEINELKPLLDALRKGNLPVAGSGGAFLGVSTETVTPDVQATLNLRPDSGALVDDVTPGAAAESAGLQRGDVIVGFDGKPVTSSTQLRQAIQGKKPGDRVTIDYYRGSDKRSADAVLVQRPGP